MHRIGRKAGGGSQQQGYMAREATGKLRATRGQRRRRTPQMHLGVLSYSLAFEQTSQASNPIIFCWERALQKFVLRIQLHGAVYSVPLFSRAFHFASTIGEIALYKLQMYTGSGYRDDIKGLRLGVELFRLP